MVRAVIDGAVVAEAPAEMVIGIEGNAYFPADAVVEGILRDSPTPYMCPWKGTAQYHDLVVGEMVVRDGAWSYPQITQFAKERVGRDFSGYVAFDGRYAQIES